MSTTRRPPARRERAGLPTWVTALVLILVVFAIVAVFWRKASRPSGLKPEQTPQFQRMQKELIQTLKEHPERAIGRTAGQKPAAQRPGPAGTR